MNLVSDLDLPAFDYAEPDVPADRYHAQLAGIRQHGWLARSPLAYLVLDHDAGEFFLRSKKTAFPGRQIAGFSGVSSGPLAEHIDANILNLSGEHHRRLRANREGDGGEGFDITTAHAGRLLTFGAGDHYCPGANLARAELEEALAFLAPRASGLALDGPPQLGGIEGIYGIDKLPVSWSGTSAMSPNRGRAPNVS
jgi:cytochrome P450